MASRIVSTARACVKRPSTSSTTTHPLAVPSIPRTCNTETLPGAIVPANARDLSTCLISLGNGFPRYEEPNLPER